MRRRLLLSIVLFTAAAAAAVGASTADASEPCVTVQTIGTLPHSNNYVHECLPVSQPEECVERDAGLDPTLHVYITVCVPS